MITITRFLQVFTTKGVKFVPLDENLPEAPEDIEIINIREIEGYGIQVGEEWQVFPTAKQAEQAQ